VLAGNPATSPSDVYQGLRAQRRELARQLEWLEEKRGELQGQLQEPGVAGANLKGLEQRMADLDSRIAAIDKQMGATEAELSRAAAVPGAMSEEPAVMGIGRAGPPEEAYVLGGIFMFIVLLPLSVALARRIWRRGATAIASIPKELSAQLARLEQAIESIAIEVERIGEGQRFMSKVVAEGGARALGPGAAEPLEVKARDAVPERRGK
jgi:septal ring factor EnvC (AmiA/AmiB activator)